MAKSFPFSVFLLKEGQDHTTALQNPDDLEPHDVPSLPEGSHFFVLNAERKRPWWRGFLGLNIDIWQEQKGAVAFVPVDDRYFALTFGHVSHHLNDYAYEYDFGLLVTLNSLDPSELKSADMVAPGAAMRKRTQVAVSRDLTYLDFDSNSEIIRSLTGKVKAEYRDIFKSATGSSSLRVNLKINPNQIANTLGSLLQVYELEDYKDQFPNIQNITPVNDPQTISELNESVAVAVREESNEVALAIPEIIDFRDTTCCFFRGHGKKSQIYPDITIEAFFDFLGPDDVQNIDLERLKSYQVVLCDVDGIPAASHSIYRSLVYDHHAAGVLYHLTDGKWYKAEEAFLERVRQYLNARVTAPFLPEYNHDAVKDGKSVYSEGNYNSSLTEFGFICLDQTDISPSGNTQIEPCDAYRLENTAGVDLGTLYHVKISTRSSSLSHLFNQGVNSITLVRLEPSSRQKLVDLIKLHRGNLDEATHIAPVVESRFKVVYGIITHKDPNLLSDNLPLFAKLSLYRAFQQFEMYTVPASLTFVHDASPKKHGHEKDKRIRVVVAGEGKKRKVVTLAAEGVEGGLIVKYAPKEVREAEIGSEFILVVRENDDGSFRSYHDWDFDVVE